MHHLEEITKKEEKLRVTIGKGIEAESIELTLAIEKKRKANNDAIHNKEVIKEKRSIRLIARVRNIEKKVSNMIVTPHLNIN